MATTDQQLLHELQGAVVETPNQGARWPSGLWTVGELTDLLMTAQAQLLADTQILVARATLVTIPQVTRSALPADWLATVRATWIDPSGATRSLVRENTLALDLMLPAWDVTTSTTGPVAFVDAEVPTLEIQAVPAALDSGQIGLLYLKVPTLVNNSGLPLSIPDECVPAVKWKVLELMLGKVGRAHDPDRAAYCASRYEEIVDAVRAQLDGWGA